MKTILLLSLTVVFNQAMAGGGTAGFLCEYYEPMKSSENEKTANGCKDNKMEIDMLQCGYGSKWTSYNKTFAENNAADYCMWNKGYRYKNHPNGRSFCEKYPEGEGCEEAIRKYKKSNAEVVN